MTIFNIQRLQPKTIFRPALPLSPSLNDAGTLAAPQVVQSTGSTMLDTAIINQLAGIKLPRATGSDTGMPHAFEMSIGMYPSDISIFKAIHKILLENIHYPMRAEQNGTGGTAIAGFTYKDGRITDARIEKSSGSGTLDRTVIRELQTVSLPEPPGWIRSKAFKFSVAYCFGVIHQACAHRMQVRYMPAGESLRSSASPCAEVEYDYANGIISGVHLVQSSNDDDWDKHALAEAAQGKLPPSLERGSGSYTLPICRQPIHSGQA